MAELPRRGGDFFEALIPSATERLAYRIEVFPASATLTLPPLATLFLVFSPPSA